MQLQETTDRTPPAAIGQPNRLFNVVVFLIFAVLWLAFGVALLVSHDLLGTVWAELRDLPLVVQGLAWLVLLPIVAGLGIWQQDWALWLRLLLIAGLAIANLVTFFPWRSEPRQLAAQ